MNLDDFKNIDMTPEEKIKAVSGLKEQLEENFVILGQLLSEIKRNKLFKHKGYKTFKEFVVPRRLVGDSEITITFDKPEESHLNWRKYSKVSDVWLIKR